MIGLEMYDKTLRYNRTEGFFVAQVVDISLVLEVQPKEVSYDFAFSQMVC